jgi:acetolactate synthase I/II/III large subunit
MTGITLPITKHNFMVTDVRELGHVMREAFYIARTGRPGPVLVEIPKDIQEASCDWTYEMNAIRLPGYRPDLRPISKNLEQAIEMINTAKRPVILAGRGVAISGAMHELQEFAEKTRTPVAMTLMGLGSFPANHPLSLGMMGMHGESWVNHTIQQSDLVLAFGMRFDGRVTGSTKSFAKNARKIHFDIDPSEINKNVKVDVGLVGDLRETLQRLMPSLDALDHSEWNEHIDEMRTEGARHNIINQPDNGYLFGGHVINDLCKYTGGDSIVVADVGQNQMWAAQYYPHNLPFTILNSGGLGAMGFGLPAAIGAKFARPESEVWVVAGDGGFQMTQAELSTIAQEGIKINIAIINNGYLGMVRQWQEFFYKSRYQSTPMLAPDFVKIAEAHGLTGLRVTRRDQIQDAVRQAREAEGTVLIDFQVVKEDDVYPMVPAGGDLHVMIRRPLPQEINR